MRLGRFPRWRATALSILTIAICAAALAPATQAAPAGTALDFDGSNDYVTFGNPAALGLSTFTLEVWFKREGAGTGVTTAGTGGGGIAGSGAVPLLTKGRGEIDAGDQRDMNWFLGIDVATNVLVVDFEEAPAGSGASGLNHAYFGTQAIAADGTWHHAAATYDGTWHLYLDGVEQGTGLVVNEPPRSDSTQHAALATGIQSNGTTTGGAFNGVIDEARVWNVARTQAEIVSTKDMELASAPGLVARWGLNEGTGTTVASSAGTTINGTVSGTAPLALWVAGFPLPDLPPATPTGLTAAAGDGLVALSWNAVGEADVVGYNVYRDTVSPVSTAGAPVNGGTPVTGTRFTEGGLGNGQTYFYAVTAVDAAAHQSGASNEATATPLSTLSNGLDFDGSNDYVTFGNNAALGVSSFTLELWFKQEGAGAATGTGNGGISGVPLITKGRAEVDGGNRDMNYFFGIDSANRLVADFEDTATGGNHPITANTAIPADGAWHHAAVTYDAQTGTWNIYLDGANFGTLTLPSAFAPRADSIQHGALGSAITSSLATPTPAVAAGFFSGVIDEARVWSVARTQAEIQSTKDQELTSATDLVARWALEEGSGTIVGDASGNGIAGVATNGPIWIPGAPIGVGDTTAPGAPSSVAATPGDGLVALTWNANGEVDLDGYNVYRDTASPVSTEGTPLNGGTPLSATSFTDPSAANDTPYFYAVTAVDQDGNESAGSEASVTPLETLSNGLDFNGAGDYVSFGPAAGLGSATFTVETWFRRDGTGDSHQTGDLGIPDAIPLVTKGTAEAEGSDVDMNWFLGIRESTNHLVADFEEDPSGSGVAGLNHPVEGVTPIPADGTWHHAAMTYDGTWKLYLDGDLEAELVVNEPPRADSIQPAALATGIRSNGTTLQGFFDGALDEVRVWNVARTQAQIQASKDVVVASATGLRARWALEEGEGAGVADSTGNGFAGTIGGGPVWIPGAPVGAGDTSAPAAPAGVTAAPGNGLVGLDWTANAESDLQGYNVYRDTVTPVPTTGTPLNGGTPLAAPTFTDTTAVNGTAYFYAVTAVDASDNESAGTEASATPLATLSNGLDFDGVDDHVTFGVAPQLGSATFTLETWFKRQGDGVAADTGAGGIDSVPLITKGQAQTDDTNVDMNYFLGIDPVSNHLVADFEEGAAGTDPGLNHPYEGTTAIPADNTWHHVAATYDGTTWHLYLDGVEEGTGLVVGQPARADSIQHAALGSSIDSNGVLDGFFDGVLDEPRIWNYARTAAQVNASKDVEVLSTPGLVGRWGLNASSGTNVADSSGSGVNGTAVGGPSWVPGYPLGAPTPVLAFTPGSVSMAVVDGGSGSETVDLAVSDGSAAAFTVSGDAEAWLTVSPLSGATPATLTLDVDASALTPGSYSATVTAVASGFPNETLQVNLEVTPATTPFALDFDGTNDHVTFGLAPGLGAAQFTIETWFMRQGPGTSVETGTNGIPDAVPLVTKGTSETDDTNVDMNYYLGIDQSAGVLIADFEEGATGSDPGLNHPVSGTTVITNNVWHHAAATYDGQVLKLYLDGILQGSLTVNQPVRSDSIQHAALGTGITSTGTPEGFFEGVLDEARIWNVARTVDQINATKDVEVTSATGLIGRWGMNEGAGTSVGDSSGGGTNGTATGGPAWVAGYPFSGVSNTPPGVTLNAPADGATGFSTDPTLDVTTSDADGGDVTTTFFGRQVSGAPGPEFTIVAVPDTQHYVDQNGANLAHFTAQMNWILAHKSDMNIAFVSQLGDLVEHIDQDDLEWQRTSSRLAMLDSGGVKNGNAPGNHDISSSGVGTKYDQYFPVSRYSPVFPWYGGHLGDDPQDPINRQNKDNYQLFSASGIDFIIIHLEYDIPDYALEWAARILEEYPNRQAILSTHAFLNTSAARPSSPIARSDGNSAQTVWNELVTNHCNVFLFVNGHYPGEARRTDLNDCGEPVHQVLTDYQSRINGGDGWLRYYTFKPAENKIYAYTYSPSRNAGQGEFETDAGSQFTLDYDMNGSSAGFQEIGSSTGQAGNVTQSWPGRSPSTEYEWYATVSDGQSTTTSATRTFTTGAPANQPPVVDSVVIDQASPKTNDALTATVTSHDPDGPTPALTYQWLKGGLPIATGTTATLNLATDGNGDEGEAISLRVTASDGSLQSAPVTSAAVTIQNTAPTATVSLAPANPGTNATLTATATRTDADVGDTVSLTYVWKVDGVAVKTTASTASLTDTLDLSVAGNGDAGQTVSVEVTPNDGTVNGAVVSAQATVVGGGGSQVLTFTAVEDSYTQSDSATQNNGSSTTLRVRTVSKTLNSYVKFNVAGVTGAVQSAKLRLCVTTDPGADGGSVFETTDGWAEGTINHQNQPGSLGSALSSLNAVAASTCYELDLGTTVTGNGPASYVVKGDVSDAVWYASSESSADNKPQLIVTTGSGGPGNNPPSATVSLSDTTPGTADVLTATATRSDPDAGDTVSLTYVWKVDGVAVKTTASTASLTDTLDLSVAGNGDAGQTVSVEVTPNDGTVNGSVVSAQAIVAAAGNQAPVVDSVVIDQASPKTSDTLSATVQAHDPDGPAPGLEYQWLKNGLPISGANGATLNLATSGNGDEGDPISLRVTANDGSLLSPPVTSTAVTVQNSVPSATVGLSSPGPGTADVLTATATRSDPDAGDTVSLTYVWKVDGVAVKTTASTASLTDTLDLSVAGNGDAGQTVSVEVTPNDGTVNGAVVSAQATVVGGGGSQVLTFTAVEDSYTQSDSATQNNGSSTTLRVRTVSKTLNSYVKFNVAGVTGAVQSAKLRLCVTTDPGADGGSVFETTDGWAEGTINHQNQPGSLGSALSSLNAVAASTCYELDLGTTVTGNGPASYVVKGDVSDAVWYASSESSADNKPQLIVTTGSGGPGNNPPSATVSLSDTTPGTADVLTATATRSDPDAGDTVSLTYVWKVDGVAVKTTASTASLTDTLDLSVAGNGDAGQTVSVEVTPNDGTVNGAVVSAQATVVGGGGSQVLTFTAVEDSYTQSDSATQNNGSSTTLRVRAVSKTLNSYVKFNVAGVTGAVQSAKLRLCVTTDPGADGGSVFETTDGWAEGTINHQNQPGSLGSALSSLGAVAASTCYELDLGTTVTGNGPASYVVKGDVSDAVWYASSESSADNKPQLIVTTG